MTKGRESKDHGRRFMRNVRRLAYLCACLMMVDVLGAVLAQVACASTPESERQLVYVVDAWDGRTYRTVFAPETVEGPLYLWARVDNILRLYDASVYYWPITQEYRLDKTSPMAELQGSLEVVKEGRAVASLPLRDFAFRVPFPGETSSLLVGSDATEAFLEYEQVERGYYDAVREYRQAMATWQNDMYAILRSVSQTGNPADPASLPVPPQPPVAPQYYVTAPEAGFCVNLPPGAYELRVVDRSGEVIAGSRRRLEVFEPRREGVGYTIMPESKWTVETNTHDPGEVLYVEREAVFYIRATSSTEVNELQYRRMVSPQKPLAGHGAGSIWTWVQGPDLLGLRMELLEDGVVVETLDARPYSVQQNPGPTLGYEIIEFDPTRPSMSGKRPTFSAFRIEIDPTPGARYAIRLVGGDGRELPNSYREIRVVRQEGRDLLVAVSVLPSLAAVGVAALRASRRRWHRKSRSADPVKDGG